MGHPVHPDLTCLYQKNVALPLFIKHKSSFQYDVHSAKKTIGGKRGHVVKKFQKAEKRQSCRNYEYEEKLIIWMVCLHQEDAA